MKKTVIFTALGLVISGCANLPPQGPSAIAQLQPTKGNSASGTVTFAQKGDKVVVVANVKGLVPGKHGFHIHEKGDCSSDDGMSTGGHFNPHGGIHAHPSNSGRHAGDMPELEADGSGNATLTVELDGIAIGGGLGNIIGKGVIVHKDPDDFKTQPTGNSGARVACGAIS